LAEGELGGGIAGLEVEGSLVLGYGGVKILAWRSGVEIGELEVRGGGVGIIGDGFAEGGEGFGWLVRGGVELAELELDYGGFVGRGRGLVGGCGEEGREGLIIEMLGDEDFGEMDGGVGIMRVEMDGEFVFGLGLGELIEGLVKFAEGIVDGGGIGI